MMRPEFGRPEWVSLVFFSFFIVLAWLRPLEWRRRRNVTALGGFGIALLSVLFPSSGENFLNFRRILPLILSPLAYWQTGQFTAPLNRRLQSTLVHIDHKILSHFEGI